MKHHGNIVHYFVQLPILGDCTPYSNPYSGTVRVQLVSVDWASVPGLSWSENHTSCASFPRYYTWDLHFSDFLNVSVFNTASKCYSDHCEVISEIFVNKSKWLFKQFSQKKVKMLIRYRYLCCVEREEDSRMAFPQLMASITLHHQHHPEQNQASSHMKHDAFFLVILQSILSEKMFFPNNHLSSFANNLFNSNFSFDEFFFIH